MEFALNVLNVIQFDKMILVFRRIEDNKRELAMI